MYGSDRLIPFQATGLVTLVTDFGDADGFVGAMRGVLLSRAPAARIFDIAHHVPRGNVAKAARVLRRAAPWFPSGTVHLVVVDPGVGSDRRALVVCAGGHAFVAPDNGVLGPVLERLGTAGPVRELTRVQVSDKPPSATFHGRDVFAPAAGAIAAGVEVSTLGTPLDVPRLVHLDSVAGTESDGYVVEVDVFGNLITDLPAPSESITVECAGVRVCGPSSSYSAVESGDLVLVVGSDDTLEIAVRDGSATLCLGVGVGARVAFVAGCDRS